MKVSLVTLGDPGKQTGGYLYHRRLADAAPRHAAEVRFVSFPECRFPLPLLAGGRILNEVAGADVVVIDSIAAAFAAPWFNRLRKPVVGSLHQRPGGIDHGPLRSRLQADLDRRAYRHMDILIVASEPLQKELLGVHPDVRVVAPGRDVSDTVRPYGGDLLAGREVAFLCVANWTARKGIIELLDAFSALPEHAATLHLVGDQEVDRRYASRVRRHLARLGGRVVVHGILAKEQVASLYKGVDVYVMPSWQEPYGTVYGEAMAMGLPVVGWRAGNLPYLARDGHEGLVVEPGDVAALSAALRRLAEDADLRRRMGAAAKARAETFPTWEETAANFFGVIRSVCEPLAGKT